MLAQILRDMYIAPALLAELDDDQKSVLFCKMREEQIRRWRLRETEDQNDCPKPKESSRKQKRVGFLLGADGKPWTWVVGDGEPPHQPLGTHRHSSKTALSGGGLVASVDPETRLTATNELTNININNINNNSSNKDTISLNRLANGHLNNGRISSLKRPTSLPLNDTATRNLQNANIVNESANQNGKHNPGQEEQHHLSNNNITNCSSVNNKSGNLLNNHLDNVKANSGNGVYCNGLQTNSLPSSFVPSLLNDKNTRHCTSIYSNGGHKPHLHLNGKTLNTINGDSGQAGSTTIRLDSVTNGTSRSSDSSNTSTKPVVEVRPMVKVQQARQPNTVNFEFRSSAESDLIPRNGDSNALNLSHLGKTKNGSELLTGTPTIASAGTPGGSPTNGGGNLEDELERLVRDVAELSSPVQPDKQRWLREKLDLMRARDLSLPSSPAASPGVAEPQSDSRHEVFRSSPSNGSSPVSVSPSGHQPKNGAQNTPSQPSGISSSSIVSNNCSNNSNGSNNNDNNNSSSNNNNQNAPNSQDWNSIDEQAWLEQERRAKEADALRRRVARNAREEIKRASQLIINDDLAYDVSTPYAPNVDKEATTAAAATTATNVSTELRNVDCQNLAANGTAVTSLYADPTRTCPKIINSSAELNNNKHNSNSNNNNNRNDSDNSSKQTGHCPAVCQNTPPSNCQGRQELQVTDAPPKGANCQKPAVPPSKPALLPKPSLKPPLPPKNSSIRSSTAVFQGPPPMQATSRSRDAKVFERTEVETWFVADQLNVGMVSENSRPGEAALWFHGFLPRPDAEMILASREEGSFLVRVHDRIKGYVVSYKAADKVKHFLVDASQSGQVQFFGANQIIFRSIVHLVHFHMTQPVSVAGRELLRVGISLAELSATGKKNTNNGGADGRGAGGAPQPEAVRL